MKDDLSDLLKSDSTLLMMMIKTAMYDKNQLSPIGLTHPHYYIAACYAATYNIDNIIIRRYGNTIYIYNLIMVMCHRFR